MLSCKDTTALASHRLDGRLPISTRLHLWLHLLICVHCRRYVQQLRVVTATLKQFAQRREHISNEVIEQQTEKLSAYAKSLHEK